METDGHGKSYGEWKHEKEGTPTLRGMVKTDVEMAMTAADSFAGFVAELQKKGYAVKYGSKAAHMTVRHKEAQKNIRLDKISPHFSEDSLRRYFRELQTLPPEMQQEYKQQTCLFAAAHGVAADGTAVAAKLPGLWLAIIATVHC